MKLDTFGTHLVKHKVGTVENISVIQHGKLLLQCAFYDWGIRKILPAVQISPTEIEKQIICLVDHKGAIDLTDQQKLKLLADNAKRFKGKVDLGFDYKFLYEDDLEDTDKQLLEIKHLEPLDSEEV